MSSPFQSAFMAKTPFAEKGTITLSEEELKNPKPDMESEKNSQLGNVSSPSDLGPNPNYNSTYVDDNEFDTPTGRPLTGPNVEPPKKKLKA